MKTMKFHMMELFYTVNLLNAKWKVVPARNSGWKKRVPIDKQGMHLILTTAFIYVWM